MPIDFGNTCSMSQFGYPMLVTVEEAAAVAPLVGRTGTNSS